MSLSPKSLLWIVGKVEIPEYNVLPVTPIDMGLEDLTRPLPVNLPHENLPLNPVDYVTTPVVFTPVIILHIIDLLDKLISSIK